MNERRYLFQELVEEVNKDYASIVVNAWSMVLNAERYNLSKPKIKSLHAECAGMRKAALLVIKNCEYLDDSLTPEERLDRDKKRYEEAYKTDQDLDEANRD